MSAKDFALIAAAVRSYTDNKAERENMARHFASVLQNSNDRFDTELFVRVCVGKRT